MNLFPPSYNKQRTQTENNNEIYTFCF